MKINTNEKVSIILKDVLGKEVKVATGNKDNTVYFDNIPSGIYALLIFNEHLRQAEKVVVD